MRFIRRLPRAVADLDDIWLYIAQDNPAAATRVVDAILNATQRLLDHPYSGPAKPNIRPGMRKLSVARYVVLYRVNIDTIDIVRVVHQARDLDALALD